MMLAALAVVGIFACAEKVSAARQGAAWEAAQIAAREAAAAAEKAEDEAREKAKAEAAEKAEQEAKEQKAREAAEEEARKEAEIAEKRAAMEAFLASPHVESEAEKQIYSYVQCPPGEYRDPRWTGHWARIDAGGTKFYMFGCGICCLANTVSTLTEQDINPAKMFWMAQELSDYLPRAGVGAIDWTQMGKVLDSFRLQSVLRNKPASYREFRNDVAGADATTVLVCKDNDDSLWFYTNGHYVTLWGFDPEDQTVFVTDSSGLYNRRRVSLYAVYKALKTKSTAQYMCVSRMTRDGQGS